MDIADLRSATEEDVTAALKEAWISLPIATPTEALELFNVMLDHLTGERFLADVEDANRIAAIRDQELRKPVPKRDNSIRSMDE